MTMTFRSIALAVLTLGLAMTTANAAPLFERAVYNEETKSYFELVDISRYNTAGGTNAGVPWFKAIKLAERRSFGGVKGRLARIPSATTDMFVRLTFRPDRNTWFDLYYDCGRKVLSHANGEKYPANGYTNWRDPWFRGQQGMFCRVNYSNQMPVFIAFNDADRAWAIQLPAKYYLYYLVEYPTGGRLANEKDLRTVSEPFSDLLK